MVRMMIKVFGSDPPCQRCRVTERIVREAISELGLDAQVSHISADSKEADQLGIMLTPAIVVDGKLVASGRVPSKGEMKKILRALASL